MRYPSSANLFAMIKVHRIQYQRKWAATEVPALIRAGRHDTLLSLPYVSSEMCLLAASSGQTKTLQSFLNNNNTTNHFDLLQRAVTHGHLDTVCFLWDHQPQESQQEVEALLYYAIQAGQQDMMNWLHVKYLKS